MANKRREVKNVGNEDSVSRGSFAGRILPLFFIIFVLVLVLIGAFLLYNDSFGLDNENIQGDFSVDQGLMKVLLKEDEKLIKEIRVMDIGDNDLDFSLSTTLGDLIVFSEDTFSLSPGQTKVVEVGFSTVLADERIEYSPGIYIGKITVISGDYSEVIPTIIEIESEEVLFDMNINFPTTAIEPGDDFSVNVRLYNLMSTNAMNINIEHYVKDLDGNTLFTDSETVVVDTQVAFTKSISLPSTFSEGTYVYGAIAKYAGSTGTSSYVFEVSNVEEESSNFCPLSNPICMMTLFIFILLFVFVFIYLLFFFRVYLRDLFYRQREALVRTKERVREKVQVKERSYSFVYFALFLIVILIVALFVYLYSNGGFGNFVYALNNIPVVVYLVVLILIIILVTVLVLHYMFKSWTNVRTIVDCYYQKYKSRSRVEKQQDLDELHKTRVAEFGIKKEQRRKELEEKKAIEEERKKKLEEEKNEAEKKKKELEEKKAIEEEEKRRRLALEREGAEKKRKELEEKKAIEEKEKKNKTKEQKKRELVEKKAKDEEEKRRRKEEERKEEERKEKEEKKKIEKEKARVRAEERRKKLMIKLNKLVSLPKRSVIGFFEWRKEKAKENALLKEKKEEDKRLEALKDAREEEDKAKRELEERRKEALEKVEKEKEEKAEERKKSREEARQKVVEEEHRREQEKLKLKIEHERILMERKQEELRLKQQEEKRKEEEKAKRIEDREKQKEREEEEKENEIKRKEREEHWEEFKDKLASPFVKVKSVYRKFRRRKEEEEKLKIEEELQKRKEEKRLEWQRKREEEKLKQMEQDYELQKQRDVNQLKKLEVKLKADEFEFNKVLEIEKESLLKKSGRSFFANLKQNFISFKDKSKHESKQEQLRKQFHKQKEDSRKERLMKKIKEENSIISKLKGKLR